MCVRVPAACDPERRLIRTGMLSGRRRGVEPPPALRGELAAIAWLPCFLLTGSECRPGWCLRACFNLASLRAKALSHPATVHLYLISLTNACFCRICRPRLPLRYAPVKTTGHCPQRATSAVDDDGIGDGIDGASSKEVQRLSTCVSTSHRSGSAIAECACNCWGNSSARTSYSSWMDFQH
jgi:hypothetical protein